ncbi:MAG: TonB-dependent receptor [Desulfovermiculus sp.]
MRKRVVHGWMYVLTAFLVTVFMTTAVSAEEQAQNMDEIRVTAKKVKEPSTLEPEKNVINLDSFETIGVPQNVGQIVKDSVIIDDRGYSRLQPDDDTMFMRGFSSKRFVTSIDGSTIRKTGGRRGSHIVDYALLPPFLIDSVEVLPGPHSALYPAKSIGGVVNFQTRAPARHPSLRPDVTLSSSYETYDTQNHNISLQGSAGDFTYDLGYQKYRTDGYLRHNEADFDTVFGRLGYILPNDGWLTLTASYADIDRERPIINDPDDPESNYDSDYPEVHAEGRSFYDWQDPTWDKVAPNYRMDMELPTSFGTWRANAFYGEESRDRYTTDEGHWVTEWRQQGGKVSNEFTLAQGHELTAGMDVVQCYDGYRDEGGPENKRIENLAGFAQYKWSILPSLTLSAGLRYEDISFWADNTDGDGGYDITGQYDGQDDIKRSWDELLPKSFLTYKLDGLADFLRDTSISAGVSKIWRAPDYHGDYCPQGKPTGAWLDPEHGVGYDLVLNRRLLKDIQLKLNYSYYEIEDFMAGNADPEYGSRKKGGTVPEWVPAGQEYKDYHVNLEEITRQGIEVQLSGHLTDKLHCMLGYSWQEFDYDGDKYKASANEEIAERPEHMFKAKLTYHILDTTSVTLNYEYQDDQVAETWTETSPDVYEVNRTKIDAYDLVGLSLKHTLFENWHGLRKGSVQLFAHNLLDEDYQATNTFPGTDLTVGTGITLNF